MKKRKRKAATYDRAITYRTLTINFVSKTVDVDGLVYQCDAPMLSIPLVDSERPLFPKTGLSWVGAAIRPVEETA